MILYIVKRDGRVQPFDKEKIVAAICKAFEAVDGSVTEYAKTKAKNIANAIEEQVAEGEFCSIEEIQDAVEDGLARTKRKDVAKHYILYRDERARERRKSDNTQNLIREKLRASNVQNQNANVDEFSFGGRMGEANSVVMKQLALDELIPEKMRENHLNNRIYIHDLDHYYIGDHNCFDRSVKFITEKGVKSFYDFNDGDNIKVLTPKGTWENAIVKNYGYQKVIEYIFKRNRTEEIIKATPNHRWLNEDGKFQEGLVKGQKLLDPTFIWEDYNFDKITNEEKKYWCFGFVYGDGTIIKRKDRLGNYYENKTSKVKLCGDKVKYLKRFQECGWGLNCTTEEPEVHGIPYLKELPDFDSLPIELLISFIHGLYDADGCHSYAPKTELPIYSIQFTSKENCDFVEKYFPVAGLFINSIKDKTGQETNFGIRTFTKNYQFTAIPSNKYSWYVKDIKDNNEIVDVWCLEVENEKSFVLEKGITTGNCLSIPFDDLLKNGFNTRQMDIRPAKSISTALQLVAVIMQIQSLQQFGGVSATHLDWTMVPYVRLSFYKYYKEGQEFVPDTADKTVTETTPIDKYKNKEGKLYQYAMHMTKKELHQSIEGLYHNLNTLQSRSGNQLPFSSINYGSCTLPEGRMVTEELLNVSIEGLGKFHRTSIFPCGIFKVGKGINKNPGDPNYDLFQLALKSTATRLYPNYANLDWSGNSGYDPNDPETEFSTMGCRTANGWDINGFKQMKDGRGNIAPSTIILPTLAMEAVEEIGSNGTKEEYVEAFMKILDEAIDDCMEGLKIRFEWIASQSPNAAKFMYENNTMRGYVPEEGIRSALKHGTLAVGNLGLAEALQLLIACDHTDPEGMKLAKRIYQLFKDKCAKAKEKEKLNYGVYFTPKICGRVKPC